MDMKRLAIEGGIVVLLVVVITFGIQKMNTKEKIAGATQSVVRGVDEHFVACPLSQGMLIGQQPLFIYQNTQTQEQQQLQAVKAASGIVGNGNQPICQYYNNQSKIMFTIVLPGTFPKTCTSVNTDRVGFSCP